MEGAIERQTGGGDTEEVIFKDRVEEVTEEVVMVIAVGMKIVLRTTMDRTEVDIEEVTVSKCFLLLSSIKRLHLLLLIRCFDSCAGYGSR